MVYIECIFVRTHHFISHLEFGCVWTADAVLSFFFSVGQYIEKTIMRCSNEWCSEDERFHTFEWLSNDVRNFQHILI